MTDKEKIFNIIREFNVRKRRYSTYTEPNDDEELADALLANGIGDVAEWKHRAEVAEYKLLDLARFCVKGNPYLPKERSQEEEARKLFNEWLKQAEREIEEERK